mmetsp:Transcript_3488/g.6734  ORF Transcript_3488/g.6734 Transcript_3488/m.6734 type:complete len:777 (-) Transcript_3488:171-2501(-)
MSLGFLAPLFQSFYSAKTLSVVPKKKAMRGSTSRCRLLLPLVLCFVALRHVPQSSASASSAAVPSHQRQLQLQLQQSTTPAPTPSPTTQSPNPYQPHDRICRQYLRTFLKGTTDARDECEGLLNAYAAGDCKVHENPDGTYDDDENGGHGDPWRKWWHDLFGDDDLPPPDDGGGGTDLRRRLDLLDAFDDDQVTMIDDTYENYACCSTIRSYYTVRCPNPDENKIIDPTILLLIASILIACGVVKSIIRSMDNRFVRTLPEAAGCILVGAAAGIVVRVLVPGVDLDRVAFDEDLFLSIFLPPIIFQATLAIDKKALGRNIVPVATFAVLGTVMSALLTAGMLFVGTMATSTPIPGLDATIFGALISSIDPVATLSVLSAVGIGESETIYVLVFGESLLNDGVAIVLFKTLLDHLDGRGWDDGETVAGFVGEVAAKVCAVTAGSIAIGLLSGIACTFYFWSLRGRHIPVVEVGIFFIWALVPYYIGDAIGYSSVISMMATLFFADLFVIGRHSSSLMANAHANFGECEISADAAGPPSQEVIGRQHPLFSTAGQLSSISRHHIGFVAEVVSSLMETIIFAYLGLFLFTNKHHDIPLSLIAIFACVGSRAAMVGSLSWILNGLRIVYRRSRQLCCNRREIILSDSEDNMAQPEEQQEEAVFLDRRMQRVLFLSGIRGAVSLALVENIPLYNAVTKEGSQFKAELKTMTISSIIFTVFAFGSATYSFMKNDALNGGGNGRRSASGRMNQPLLSDDLLLHHEHATPENDDNARVEIDHAL